MSRSLARASSTSRVWSVLALSTTKTASGLRVCAASPSSIPVSRSARLKVTMTTATDSGHDRYLS